MPLLNDARMCYESSAKQFAALVRISNSGVHLVSTSFLGDTVFSPRVQSSVAHGRVQRL